MSQEISLDEGLAQAIAEVEQISAEADAVVDLVNAILVAAGAGHD